jgi:hypothetical protein
LEATGGLARDFQDAFRLAEGTPEARFISTATAIAARWVGDLGMPGTIPREDRWQRLAEKLNLRMLIYPPDQNDVAGQPMKATLRITGEFALGAATHLSSAGVEAATVSTPSSPHGRQMRPATCEG